jgi:hypothetical protein
MYFCVLGSYHLFSLCFRSTNNHHKKKSEFDASEERIIDAYEKSKLTLDNQFINLTYDRMNEVAQFFTNKLPILTELTIWKHMTSLNKEKCLMENLNLQISLLQIQIWMMKNVDHNKNENQLEADVQVFSQVFNTCEDLLRKYDNDPTGTDIKQLNDLQTTLENQLNTMMYGKNLKNLTNSIVKNMEIEYNVYNNNIKQQEKTFRYAQTTVTVYNNYQECYNKLVEYLSTSTPNIYDLMTHKEILHTIDNLIRKLRSEYQQHNDEITRLQNWNNAFQIYLKPQQSDITINLIQNIDIDVVKLEINQIILEKNYLMAYKNFKNYYDIISNILINRVKPAYHDMTKQLFDSQSVSELLQRIDYIIEEVDILETQSQEDDINNFKKLKEVFELYLDLLQKLELKLENNQNIQNINIDQIKTKIKIKQLQAYKNEFIEFESEKTYREKFANILVNHILSANYQSSRQWINSLSNIEISEKIQHLVNRLINECQHKKSEINDLNLLKYNFNKFIKQLQALNICGTTMSFIQSDMLSIQSKKNQLLVLLSGNLIYRMKVFKRLYQQIQQLHRYNILIEKLTNELDKKNLIEKLKETLNIRLIEALKDPLNQQIFAIEFTDKFLDTLYQQHNQQFNSDFMKELSVTLQQALDKYALCKNTFQLNMQQNSNLANSLSSKILSTIKNEDYHKKFCLRPRIFTHSPILAHVSEQFIDNYKTRNSMSLELNSTSKKTLYGFLRFAKEMKYFMTTSYSVGNYQISLIIQQSEAKKTAHLMCDKIDISQEKMRNLLKKSQTQQIYFLDTAHQKMINHNQYQTNNLQKRILQTRHSLFKIASDNIQL